MIKNKIVRHISPDGTQVFHDTTLIGDGTPNSKLRLSGKIILNTYTPTAANDPIGEIGEVTWDDDNIYIKTSAGWATAALTLIP